MRMCVFCKTRYSVGTKITFHKFPADSSKIMWLKNMKVKNWIPKTYEYLCSKHFTKDCFVKHASRTTLRAGSVPTIFTDITAPTLPKPEESSDISCEGNDTNEIKFETVSLREPEIADSGTFAPLFTELDKMTGTCLQDDEIKLEIDVEITDSECTSRTSADIGVVTPHVTGIENGLLRQQRCNRLSPASENYHILNQPSTSGIRKKPTNQPRTAKEIFENINHDHRYGSTSSSSNKMIQHLMKALKTSRIRVKVLTQHVKRLKTRLLSLKTVIINLKQNTKRIRN